LLVELLGTESSQPWGVAPVLSWGEGNVVVRFLRLWAVGLALHFAAWTIAYFLVPEGALRGVFLSSRLPLGESSWTAVAGRIVLYNVGVAAGLVTPGEESSFRRSRDSSPASACGRSRLTRCWPLRRPASSFTVKPRGRTGARRACAAPPNGACRRESGSRWPFRFF